MSGALRRSARRTTTARADLRRAHFSTSRRDSCICSSSSASGCRLIHPPRRSVKATCSTDSGQVGRAESPSGAVAERVLCIPMGSSATGSESTDMLDRRLENPQRRDVFVAPPPPPQKRPAACGRRCDQKPVRSEWGGVNEEEKQEFSDLEPQATLSSSHRRRAAAAASAGVR